MIYLIFKKFIKQKRVRNLQLYEHLSSTQEEASLMHEFYGEAENIFSAADFMKFGAGKENPEEALIKSGLLTSDQMYELGWKRSNSR